MKTSPLIWIANEPTGFQIMQGFTERFFQEKPNFSKTY